MDGIRDGRLKSGGDADNLGVLVGTTALPLPGWFAKRMVKEQLL